MAKTTNVYARVEPDVKAQAEDVLNELGIPMSNAISMFLRQITLTRSIPFELKLPTPKPVALEALSGKEMKVELQKGLDDIAAGRVYPMEEVHAELKAEFGI
ncbi:MAG: type II toxin-antitoxin system RelB/DinJ family antitoxin [Coriobacteriia bacterium]|nr:type II toxin-antitoxin system RelB/DinJ family antitoxin [Coriobacteriia bacterium]